MYAYRSDWTRDSRDFLDPEFKYLVASDLIVSHHPNQHDRAVVQIGRASIVAGMLLVLLSVYGSTVWSESIPLESQQSLLRLAITGIVSMMVGAALVVAIKLPE